MLSITLLALAGAVAATTITTDRSVAVGKTFDYIIVGGGLSGITVGNKVRHPVASLRTALRSDGVLRNQLSGEGYSVLVIEAGPDARDNPAVVNAEERGNLVSPTAPTL